MKKWLEKSSSCRIQVFKMYGHGKKINNKKTFNKPFQIIVKANKECISLAFAKLQVEQSMDYF